MFMRGEEILSGAQRIHGRSYLNVRYYVTYSSRSSIITRTSQTS